MGKLARYIDTLDFYYKELFKYIVTCWVCVTRLITSRCQECSDYLLFFASTITLYSYTTCALCSSVLAN
jgi:hypothetical protein